MSQEEQTRLNTPPFEVTAETADGVCVLAVRGELDLSTAPQLEQAVESALVPEGGPLVIDLQGCDFIDSTGIALIVRTWQRLGGDGGGSRFALCAVNDQVRRLLDITGLDNSIPMSPSRDEAISGLRD